MNIKHSCFDNCKWRCEFDSQDDVFCHLLGKDLTDDQIEILKKVGCGSWVLGEKK